MSDLPEWKVLSNVDEYIKAIASFKKLHRCGLRKAKDAVDAYRNRQAIIALDRRRRERLGERTT